MSSSKYFKPAIDTVMDASRGGPLSAANANVEAESSRIATPGYSLGDLESTLDTSHLAGPPGDTEAAVKAAQDHPKSGVEEESSDRPAPARPAINNEAKTSAQPSAATATSGPSNPKPYGRCTDNLREYCTTATLPLMRRAKWIEKDIEDDDAEDEEGDTSTESSRESREESDNEPVDTEDEMYEELEEDPIEEHSSGSSRVTGTHATQSDIHMETAPLPTKKAPKSMHDMAASEIHERTRGSVRGVTERVPEESRRLRVIQIIDEAKFNKKVTLFSTGIPDRPLKAQDQDRDIGDYLVIPAPNFPLPLPILGHIERTESGVQEWVNAALRTVQRVVHLVFKKRTQRYKFGQPVGTGSGSMKSDMSWKRALSNHCKLVIETKGPWNFEKKEEDFKGLWHLSTLESFRAFEECVEDGKGLTNAEKVWAQVYDYCFLQKSRYFVFTTYDGWCFGVFSKGWTTAYVTKPKAFNSQNPTIIQCLIYWTMSAMKYPKGWKVKLVRDEPDLARIMYPSKWSNFGAIGGPRMPYAALEVARAR